MKKKFTFLFILLLTLVYLSCEDSTLAPAQRDSITLSLAPDGLKATPIPTPFTTCGGTYSGNYSTINSFYIYPTQNIDVACAAVGATVTVNLTALDVPNRFYILDQNNNTITSSNWLGTAGYPGSWGMALSASSTGSIWFTKASGATYKIRVETQTPPNYSYSPTIDYWSATVSCTCAACTPACGGTFSSSYSTINSFYIYPTQNFDVSCAANGATITVNLTALDVPNRFYILDASNTIVASSSWLGTAGYPGSWGMSLSASSTGSIWFTKASGATTYKIRVETQTPPNYSYSPTTDYWSATVSCP